MLSLNYSHVLSEAVGLDHGLMEQEIFGLESRLQEAHRAVTAMGVTGKLGFMDLPNRTAEARRIQSWARRLRSRFDALVVLGIGGSALGNTAIQQALRPATWNLLEKKDRQGWLRLFVLDNVDPRWTAELLAALDLKRTLVNVVSKSGTTAECLANYFIFRQAVREAVGPKRLADHFVFTTDPQKGYLRETAAREKITTFPIPANVGGRFSVLTPVGLVSAALTGVDLRQLLAGARAMRERGGSGSPKTNPAAMYAAVQYLYYQKGVRLSVLMPYSQNLWSVADWYRQLWAESLGKRVDRGGKVVNAGPTPIKALGVTDQHSQAQLYMEGPFDKIVTFLSVEDFKRRTRIPAVDKSHYLGGRTLNELLKAEEKGTRSALTKAQRPNLTLSVPEISAYTLGELFMFFEMAVAYMGELMNVNAFDQPGVELAKVYTYALMGRAGYDAQRAELAEMDRKDNEKARIV